MQSRLFLLLLRPSVFSLVTVLFATVCIIVWNNWSYFTYNDTFYSILYGEFGAITALERSPSLMQGIIEGTASHPLLYTIAILLVACLFGWVAFTFVRALRSGGQAIGDTHQQHSLLQRIGIRTLVFTLWLSYGLLTVLLIVPFCLLISRIGAEHITTLHGASMNMGAALLLALTLHVHIIFLRLFLLRPRAFGGTVDIEEATFPIHTLKR